MTTQLDYFDVDDDVDVDDGAAAAAVFAVVAVVVGGAVFIVASIICNESTVVSHIAFWPNCLHRLTARFQD